MTRRDADLWLLWFWLATVAYTKHHLVINLWCCHSVSVEVDEAAGGLLPAAQLLRIGAAYAIVARTLQVHRTKIVLEVNQPSPFGVVVAKEF